MNNLKLIVCVSLLCLSTHRISSIATSSNSQSAEDRTRLMADNRPHKNQTNIPIVINTWPFTQACQKAWEVLSTENTSALDAIDQGCSVCEVHQCDKTVGYGGSPDENGETTLDAMVMWGPTHSVGAVAGLRRIKNVIAVARKVMEHTEHTMLVGSLATTFALRMGFKEESLSTQFSKQVWHTWREDNCQPNFWKNVSPNPKTSCGPYTTKNNLKEIDIDYYSENSVNRHHTHLKDREELHKIKSYQATSHDTIGMVAIDSNGNIAAGTSTNGANHKIPGRVGDSPIAGAGAYCDQDVGGAAATGDGDVMMRTLPSYQTVENMRQGMNPESAARDSISRIVRKHSQFSGAVVALSIDGHHGAACHGMAQFHYSVASALDPNVILHKIDCT